MKKKGKKQKKQLLDALAVAAFVLQAVEFGLELWDRRKESRSNRMRPAERAA